MATKRESVKRESTAKTHRSTTTRRRAVKAEAPVAAAEPVAGDTADTAVTPEEVAAMAYSYWEQRGYQNGSDLEDWFRAEAELRSRKAQSTRA